MLFPGFSTYTVVKKPAFGLIWRRSFQTEVRPHTGDGVKKKKSKSPIGIDDPLDHLQI